MTYEYVCPLCAKTELVTKPMADADDLEYCPTCGEELMRVWTAPRIKTGDGLK